MCRAKESLLAQRPRRPSLRATRPPNPSAPYFLDRVQKHSK
ncbi:hypothetical protein CSE45_4816 [Citreicella sp. SE45]|nr:hypothetical protein CSE45_4816 [Citreicella sp. SE45]